MSGIESKITALNTLVLTGLCAGAFFILSMPKAPVPPPDDSWFNMAVIGRAEPVLVKFGANWCGPCRMMEGELDRFARQSGSRVAVVRVDVDRRPELAQHYGVSSIPRLLLFSHGQVVADRVGYADHDQLGTWVASNLRD